MSDGGVLLAGCHSFSSSFISSLTFIIFSFLSLQYLSIEEASHNSQIPAIYIHNTIPRLFICAYKLNQTILHNRQSHILLPYKLMRMISTLIIAELVGGELSSSIQNSGDALHSRP